MARLNSRALRPFDIIDSFLAQMVLIPAISELAEVVNDPRYVLNNENLVILCISSYLLLPELFRSKFTLLDFSPLDNLSVSPADTLEYDVVLISKDILVGFNVDDRFAVLCKALHYLNG